MNSTNDQIKHSTANDGKPPVMGSSLSNGDRWFVSNLQALIGGEELLVKRGKKPKIDRKMLRDWIDRHLD